MRTFLIAVVFAGLCGVVASFALNTEQKTAATVFTTTGARVSEAGHNLVGDWGNNPGKRS